MFTTREIIRRYYFLWWIYSFGGAFLYGVYPLFLRSRGLSQFQINSVLAIYFIATFLTDVPTGAIADAVGRRTAFIIGCGLRMAGYLTYFFAHSYGWFLIAEFFDGIGTTFGNGAIDAWGVDALDKAGFEGVKDRLFLRVSQLTNAGFMAAAMIGAYVAAVDIAWPWLLGTAGYLLSAVVAGLLMDEGAKSPGTPGFGKIGAELGARVSNGMRQGFRKRAVLLISIASGVELAAWAPYWMEWPRYFVDSYGLDVWVIGWIFCFFSIGRLCGAEAVVRFRPDENSRMTLLALVAALGGGLLFAAGLCVERANLVLAMLFAMNACVGAVQPLAQSLFNEHVSAGERATLLSFQSTFATFGAAFGLLMAGALADSFGLSIAWQMMGAMFLMAAPCYHRVPGRRLLEVTSAGT